MKICPSCSTSNSDEAVFCCQCGARLADSVQSEVKEAPVTTAPVQPAPAQPTPQPVYTAPAQPTPQPVYTAPAQPAPAAAPVETFDAQDVKDYKALGIMSYVTGLLVLLPCFLTKQSPYVRFHSNQGLVLSIFLSGYTIFYETLKAILSAVFPYEYNLDLFGGYTYERNPVYYVLLVLFGILFLGFAALMVIGVISAIKGKKQELPVIGKIRIFR